MQTQFTIEIAKVDIRIDQLWIEVNSPAIASDG